MPDAEERIRWTALFSGMVQGVGFRYTAEHIARRFAVTGYVKNLSDGRVQLVAEGEPAELKRFVTAVEREMAGYIRDLQINESPGTGQFVDFSIGF